MSNISDEYRSKVIEQILTPKAKEPEKVKEVVETIESDKEKKTNPKYDLDNALKEVAKIKSDQITKPKVSDEERKVCNRYMNKTLLREMLGKFRR